MDCEQKDRHSVAVALCHSCSAALCLRHAVVAPKRLQMTAPICKNVDLPVAARLVLRGTCARAMEQPHLLRTA